MVLRRRRRGRRGCSRCRRLLCLVWRSSLDGGSFGRGFPSCSCSLEVFPELVNANGTVWANQWLYDVPVLRNQAIAPWVEWLLGSVGLLDGCARGPPLALLEITTHDYCCWISSNYVSVGWSVLFAILCAPTKFVSPLLSPKFWISIFLSLSLSIISYLLSVSHYRLPRYSVHLISYLRSWLI